MNTHEQFYFCAIDSHPWTQVHSWTAREQALGQHSPMQSLTQIETNSCTAIVVIDTNRDKFMHNNRCILMRRVPHIKPEMRADPAFLANLHQLRDGQSRRWHGFRISGRISGRVSRMRMWGTCLSNTLTSNTTRYLPHVYLKAAPARGH